MQYIHKFTFAIILAAVTSSVTLGACVDDNKPVPQIQSAKDLDVYLQTARTSPLDRLSVADKQNFLNSLVFTENGLASYQYSALETLSATDMYQILSLFGVERTASLITQKNTVSNVEPIAESSGDHEGYLCSGRATCTEAPGNICTSNC